MSTDAIHVDYEYGDLHEVIVGRAELRYPVVERADWAAEALKVLPDSEAEKVRERSGKHSRDLPKHELVEAENAELIALLESFDVVVHRPDVLTDELVAANYGEEWLVNGYLQAYSRDPMFVVGDNLIELAPGTPHRRAEQLGYRRLYADRLPGSGAKWFQMPLQDVTPMLRPGYSKEGRATLEGGDLVVLGEKILAGTTVNPAVGSSGLGVEWLRSILGPQGYDVQRIRISEDFLHLDVALSIPRDGLAIVCRDAFVDGLPDCLDGWDIIDVTVEQARFLACNGLPIDPENYIVGYNDDQDGSTVQAGLEAHGITVHRIAFGNHTEDGGSIRCSTHPLVRRLGSRRGD